MFECDAKRLVIVRLHKSVWHRVKSGYISLPDTPPDAKIVGVREYVAMDWVDVKVSHRSFAPVPEGGDIPVFTYPK